MGKDGLAKAIGLAAVDKPFRTRLLRNPETAVKGFKLVKKELDFLKEEGTRNIINDLARHMSIKYSGGGKCR